MSTDPRFLDPAYYKFGATDIGQFEWLNQRLTIHGYPMNSYGDTLKRRMMDWQESQGWTGADADGYVGRVSLRRLDANPWDLSIWKLTLPTPLGGEAPTEWYPIGTRESVPWFDQRPSSLAFRAPANGAHTPNSRYPRSEFREMNKDGSKASWSNLNQEHQMSLEQAITALPAVKPHVVCAQIHDATDDVIMVRLEGPRLFVESRGQDMGDLNPNYVLGTRFRLKIVANEDGIAVQYNDNRPVLVDLLFQGGYFKAGCYTQAFAGQSFNSKTVPADTFGEVVIYALRVTHP